MKKLPRPAIKPPFKMPIIKASRPFLFSIETDKDNKPQIMITAIIRSIEFESRKKVNIEYLHDEDNTFEKFIAKNKRFFICILSRTGEVTKRFHINIRDYIEGYPKKISHEYTNDYLAMIATLELE